MKRAVLILALAGTVAAASPRDRMPAATPAGKPVNCLSLHQVRETRVRSDQVIDFYTTGRQVYRNTLPYSCPSLGFERRFVHETSIDQLCSVDTITVLQDPGLSRGATCGLGKFQPVNLVGGNR